MYNQTKSKINLSLQKRFYAILDSILKFEENFMQYALSNTFKHKELEIIFANIRV
jgi:hypothetical protein